MLASVRIWLMASGVAVALSACSTSSAGHSNACTLASPAVTDWRLTTRGTTLRDALGRVVFLRGVDAGGRSKFAPYMPFEYASDAAFPAALKAYMDRAATWGIDSMRVPWTWAALEPTQGSYDMAWLSKYKMLLDAAWARGIYTVVDFHQDIYSECLCGDGFPCWTLASPGPPAHDCSNWYTRYGDGDVEHAFDAFWASGSAVQSEYLAAWDEMITTFANEPGVVGFEPINEPAPGSAPASTFEATTLTAFFGSMIAHFVAKAPRALVFVDATGADGALVQTAMGRPTGNFVFAPHFYPVINPRPENVQPAMQPWADLGKKWDVPVWIGEFGMSHTNLVAPSYMSAHFAAFDALGLSGTEWEYSVESTEWNGETDSIVAADGTEYPVARAVVRPFARAVAGSAITQSYDPGSGTFTMSWTPVAGITEVSVPARAYPDGSSVSVSAGCYDATTVPGRVLVDASSATGAVTLSITSPVALSDGG
jgi:endoglycosylceramidase